MLEPENEKSFEVRKSKSPYEPTIGTAGPVATTSEQYKIIATGDCQGAIESTRLIPGRVQGLRQGRARPKACDSPERRAEFRAYWKTAKEAAEAMMCAAQVQDPMALLIATDNLDIELAKLWELRDARDFNWQGILNHAQGMLKQLFVEKRVELLTQVQCRCIKHLLENFLGPSSKTTADLNEAIRLIQDAGCDPYWAISGDPVEDNGAT